jgi:acetyl-CoA C-acetyltransferase
LKDAYIIGAGQTKVTRGPDNRAHKLAAAAARRAVADAGVSPADVGALYVGNMTSGILSNQLQLGALVAEHAGLTHTEALTIEAACASGAAAMRMGYLAVASGAHRAVVVCGTEQLTHANKSAATKALATAADFDLESSRSETFVTLNAALTRAYLDEYDLKPEDLAGFSITAHRNALDNEYAFFHRLLDLEQYRASRIVVEPLRLYDVSPICDGAAAVVVASREVTDAVKSARTPLVRIAGSAVATAPVALTNRANMLHLGAVAETTNAALLQAGIERRHLSLLELHDAYTIMTALSLEAGGFAEPGTAWALSRDGRTAREGDLPISTFGGLKARGHPVGATGVYQLVEAYRQLCGTAGKAQIKNAEFALTQNIGGTASTVVSHILQRVS